MALPIISADERLAEPRGIKGTIFGKSGIGKTSLLWTLDSATTLFIDLEAGDLAIEGWSGDSVRPRTWAECRDFAVFIGGPNPALRDDQVYSEAHFAAVCERFGEPSASLHRWSDLPPSEWSKIDDILDYEGDFHMYQAEVFNKIGSGVRSTLGQSDLLDLPIPVLDCEVQDNIVCFLDEKTAKIEAAIALEERQIALLKERKQIVIQNAVTKGLDPNAPMKDSGVDWIGEIPAHWEVRRNAAIFNEAKRPGNAELPVLSVSIHSGVSDRELSDEENIRSTIKIEDRSAYKEVRPGFIAYNMMRAWQRGIGAVRTFGMVSPAYVVLEPKISLNSDYFEYLYRTPAFIWQMDCNSKGITDFRKRLYWEEFKTLITLLPPVEEQNSISAAILQKAAVIDGGITLKQQQIDALKEYKATLINSAVTGKIKVA